MPGPTGFVSVISGYHRLESISYFRESSSIRQPTSAGCPHRVPRRRRRYILLLCHHSCFWTILSFSETLRRINLTRNALIYRMCTSLDEVSTQRRLYSTVIYKDSVGRYIRITRRLYAMKKYHLIVLPTTLLFFILLLLLPYLLLLDYSKIFQFYQNSG